MTAQTAPQPAEGLRQHLAEAMAQEAGSLAFRKTGTEWEHPRSVWLARADAAVNALHRWEQQGTIFRMCTIPSCLRELNIAQPERGWLQSSSVGYMCPDHGPLLWGDADDPRDRHVPAWRQVSTGARLCCSCGWDAGPTLFRNHGTVLWQAHVLVMLETMETAA
ncbi:hypothetical protein ABZ802_31600 [Streptomyces sp. NPDC047737]|uniref:hypothetical protein n=1 Tax=Streptomyces sp. NPDC047737 TaxID=3155740 RepID=UPI0033DD79DD